MQDNTNSYKTTLPTTQLSNLTMQSNDFTTISYRLDGIEKQVLHLQGQLQMYVPQRENELQLSRIQDSVQDIKSDVTEIRKQMSDITQKMLSQEVEARNRDNAQRESQDKLQIRVLYGIVSIVVTILVGVAVFWLTHFIQ